MLANPLTKGFGSYGVSGAYDSYKVVKVFCSIELMGVMCFIYIVNIFMLSFVYICINYDIDVMIRDIVCECQ
jgi:hypothetical protein